MLKITLEREFSVNVNSLTNHSLMLSFDYQHGFWGVLFISKSNVAERTKPFLRRIYFCFCRNVVRFQPSSCVFRLSGIFMYFRDLQFAALLKRQKFCFATLLLLPWQKALKNSFGVIHKPRCQNFVYFRPPVPPSWPLLGHNFLEIPLLKTH